MRFGEGSSGDDGGEGVDEECLHALCSAVLQSSINSESEGPTSLSANPNKDELSTSSSPASSASLTSTDVFPDAPVSLKLEEEEETDSDNGDDKKNTSSSLLTVNPDDVLIDADGNPASVHLDRLASLLTFITNSIPVTAVVWDLCAAVAAQRKDTREVLECRLRQCRAIQRPTGWEKDESAILSLANAASYATDCYINFHEVPLAIALIEPILARIDAGEGLCSKGAGRRKLEELINGLK
jgi:hypothetical protein